ncbi:MAG: hypothetical protein AAF725_06250 [Acidobacteriota bacterium]
MPNRFLRPVAPSGLLHLPRIRNLLVLCLGAGLSPAAGAGDLSALDFFEPQAGAVGTVVEVEGQGFDLEGSHYRAVLRNPWTHQGTSNRVLAVSPGSLRFRIEGAASGFVGALEIYRGRSLAASPFEAAVEDRRYRVEPDLFKAECRRESTVPFEVFAAPAAASQPVDLEDEDLYLELHHPDEPIARVLKLVSPPPPCEERPSFLSPEDPEEDPSGFVARLIVTRLSKDAPPDLESAASDLAALANLAFGALGILVTPRGTGLLFKAPGGLEEGSLLLGVPLEAPPSGRAAPPRR